MSGRIVSLEVLCREQGGLAPEDVLDWIAQDWLRPDGAPGHYAFQEIDVARVRLILEMRALQFGEAGMPVVLALLDQLHDSRRQLRRLHDMLHDAPEDVRVHLRTRLARLR